MFLENWTDKFFLSNRLKSSERITLSEEDDTLTANEEEVAMELNDFFSNAVINIKILSLQNFYPLSENIDLLPCKLLLSIENIWASLQ